MKKILTFRGLMLFALALAAVEGLSLSCHRVVRRTEVVTNPLVTPTGALSSIVIVCGKPSIALGTSLELTAIGLFDDLKVRDITDTVDWSSSDEEVLSASNREGTKGRVRGVGAGEGTITAASESVKGALTITITEASLVSLAIDPMEPSVVAGTSLQLHATGLFDDLTTQDLTASAAWDSSDGEVASVGNGGGEEAPAGQVAGRMPGTSAITAKILGVSGSTILTVSEARLASIEVGPAEATIAQGTEQPYQAIGVFDNGASQDLTQQVVWSSSPDAVATISNDPQTRGRATGAGSGLAVIAADLGGKRGTAHLAVTGASLLAIRLDPVEGTVPLGRDLQFIALGDFSDGRTQDITSLVTWGVGNGEVAGISNASGSRGLAHSLATGNTDVTAQTGNVLGSAELAVSDAALVSIRVDGGSPAILIGSTTQFRATGIFSDGSTSDLTAAATWLSSEAAVASLSNAEDASRGQATGLALGSTGVLAALDDVSSGPVPLTVTAGTLLSIVVSPDNPPEVGAKIRYTATGRFSDGTEQDLTSAVTWSMTEPAVATISNLPGTKGVASRHGSGETEVGATLALKYGTIIGVAKLVVP